MWRWDQQEPFGVNVPDENPSGLGTFEFPMRFPGQYADKETNLHYNYYRDHDPSLGVYKQSDPIGLDGGLNTESAWRPKKPPSLTPRWVNFQPTKWVSFTPSLTNAMLVTAHTFESATTWTPPAGMTEGFDVKYGGQSIEGNYVVQAAAGATGAKTATANGTAGDNDEGVTHILALRPASPSKLYFVHVDHLNTPRLVANQQGQTVWRWDQQEAFGNSPADENSSGLGTFELPLRLPGQYFDKEANLHYNYFRDYDPPTGRYMQPDPIGLLGGINIYGYVAANPLSHSDPHGLFDPTGWGVAAATSAGTTVAASLAGVGLALFPSSIAKDPPLPSQQEAANDPQGDDVGPDSCSPDDGYCRRNQQALMQRRQLLLTMDRAGFTLSQKMKNDFNAEVRAHNKRCSKYPVKPIGLDIVK